MAVTIYSLSASRTKVNLAIPKPVIIWPNMGIADWKNCFIQQKNEAENFKEECCYAKCFKALMWAEFCNGSLVKVAHAKGSIEFTFDFPTMLCSILFEKHLAEHLEVVALL